VTPGRKGRSAPEYQKQVRIAGGREGKEKAKKRMRNSLKKCGPWMGSPTDSEPEAEGQARKKKEDGPLA